MIILLNIAILILILYSFIGWYFCFYRNNKVCALRNEFVRRYGIEYYKKLPSYYKMCFSLKPLDIKYWRDYTYKLPF